MKINYPKEVDIIFEKLKLSGYSRFIVGGCLRDLLLGREPNDWDICTDAKPEEIKKVFSSFSVIPTGIKHGTVTVVINKKNFEITTFRTEKEYSDNRRPDKVEFTKDIYEDLKRRDFTINALAYNEIVGLVDCFNGIDDLKNKLIRTVGDPHERFTEDSLRIIRGVRLAAQLDFKIERNTASAMKKNRDLLENVSKDRIREELIKILMSDKPSFGIRKLVSLRLMEYIIPELLECVGFEQSNPNHDKDIFNHTMVVLDNIEKDIYLRLAALLHDIGKPQCFTIDEDGIGHFYGHNKIGADITEEILTRLRFDNKTISLVKLLVKEHMIRFEEMKEKGIKKFIQRVGINNLDRLFKLKIADIKGSKNSKEFFGINAFRNECKRIINQKEPITVKDLEVNGFDIMDLGIKEGKSIGILLNHLLNIVLEKPELNKRDHLIEILQKEIENIK